MTIPTPFLPKTLQTLERFAALRRPRLLIRAARFGLCDFRRERDLRRILGEGLVAIGATTLGRLLDLEETQDDLRRTGNAAYRPARHVEVLIAVMAEARLMTSDDEGQENASTIAAFRRAT